MDVLIVMAMTTALVAWAVVLHRDSSGDVSAPAQPALSVPPVAVPTPGELVRTRVRADGTLHVDHWVRSASPLFDLTLNTPRVAGGGRSRLVAQNVVLREPGHVIPGDSRVGFTSVHYDLDGARSVQVSYDLVGAVVRSQSAPARALAQVTSLDLSYDPDEGRKEVIVTGVKVRSLACATTDSDALPRPCGSWRAGMWQAKLDPSRRHDRVLAQFDLS